MSQDTQRGLAPSRVTAPSENRLVVRVVDVYPYRRLASGAVEIALFRRAEGRRYAGTWRMVGGKIEPEEAAWQAATRELLEETGCTPCLLWALPSVNTFYDWQTDRVNLVPAFGAELAPGAAPVLCAEHDVFEWLAPEGAAARLPWPEQRRLARLCAEIAARDDILRDWIVPTAETTPPEIQ